MEGAVEGASGVAHESAIGRRTIDVTLLRPAVEDRGNGPTPPTRLLRAATELRTAREDLAVTPHLVDRRLESAREGTEGRCDVLVIDVDAGSEPEIPPGNDALRVALTPDDRALAERLLQKGTAHAVLRGDADQSIALVVAALANGRREWNGVPGVSWIDENAKVHHEASVYEPQRPIAPAWDIVDLADYAPTRPRRIRDRIRRPAPEPRATIVTTAACSPDCPTCHRSFGAAARERHVEDVIAEIRQLVLRGGVRRLDIDDESFDGRPDRALEIARAIAAFRRGPEGRNLKLDFPRGLRGDGLTPALITALVDAGLERFPLRVVTAAPRLQRLLRMNVMVDRVLANLEAIDRSGAHGHLFLRLGLPTETTGEAAHTIRWARDSHAHTVQFASGRAVELGSSWGEPDECDLDDFVALRRRAYAAFYSSPRRAARLARDIPARLRRLWG